MTVDDLIAGQNVWPDTESRLREIAETFSTSTVMVTGACGSIGSILFDWLTSVGAEVIGVDHNEWEVFKKPQILLSDYSACMIPPQTEYIFHCAAYKHLPLGERNVHGFTLNNTRRLIDWWCTQRSHLPNSTKFVLVSTDKAAGTSVLGRTKREAEEGIVRNGGIAIRLANVALSHGSVLDIWDKALDPWVVPDHVERLWMSKRDALRILLQGSQLQSAVYAVDEAPRFTMGEIATAWENKTGRRLKRLTTLREGESDHEAMCGPRERMENVAPMFSRVVMSYETT